jgi:tetratricopeptide (TPR) repeat protein
MNKIRFSLLVAVVFIYNVVVAQTVEQGKQFLYYERYKSARDVFEKILAANPNNIEAVYLLGRTLIAQKDTAAAKALLQKMLATNGSAPLLLVGMGHIELLEAKNNDAKQRFETAISLTKAKDVAVINAIGFANVDAKAGDANYAIEKLTLATQTKNFSNPDTWILMGDGYRKLVDGGNAVLSYQKALAINPKMAQAKYKIGLIYLSQNNKEYFIPAFEDAIKLDPNYGPAFYALYVYYYSRDIDKAKEYFDKYLAVSDPEPSNDYDRTSILFASKRNDEAISTAKSYISSLGDKADPRYYKLIAYAYDAKADSVNAKNFLDQYFAKQKPDEFLPKDYSFQAELLSKFPGNDSLAFRDFQLAIDKDTALNDKLDLMKEAVDMAKKTGNKLASAKFAGEMYQTVKNPTNTDLYNWGYANYQAGNYKTADSIFCGIYQSKYPNEIFGYLWCARSKQAQDDSTNSQGLAVAAYEKLAQMGRSLDSVKYKPQILQAYFYLAQYYNDIKKDKQAAIGYLQKVLEVDPTNADAAKFIEILKRPPPKQPSAKPKTGAKTGSK